MAISKTNKPHSLPLLALLITMLLMLLKRVNSADSLSFTFNKFSPNQEDLILQGDASIGSGENVLQLTKFDDSGRPAYGSVGRVLYYAPVHLWKSSGQLVSSFETTFTFSISSPDPVPADGIAFFIAPPDTTPGAGGQDLGLFPHITSLKNSSSSYSHHRKVTTNIGAKDATNPVVAVEFDTYYNSDIGDPEQKHIGIDINTITSVTTTGWDWQNGAKAKAHISYDSASQRLTVVASYPDTSPVTLYYDIDLSTILPEWVRVGFSAATGGAVEANTLLSWSFTSTLHTNKIQNKDMYSVAM